MAEIRWTEEACRWMEDIYNYIAEQNPASAKKVVTEIFEKVQILLDFPQIGQMYRNEPDGEIRIFIFGHYRIAYLLKPSDDIDILGIFHTALDIDRYLL